MPVNAHPEYIAAEKEYAFAKTAEEKIIALERMLSFAPSHKGAENLRANLRLRYKKLKENLERAKKSKGGKKSGIKKEDMQALLLGSSNTGKSSLFKALTGVEAKTSPFPFSTYIPQLGTLMYQDSRIQLIDMPPFPNADSSTINVADTLVLVIDNLEQLKEIEEFIKKSPAKRIIAFNKVDLLTESEKRKLFENLRSKKLKFILVSSKSGENLGDLKKIIFESFPIIRVYTKEPRKDVSKEPMIMPKESSVKDIAEKILKGFSKKIKRTRIWGPSSKFGGQVVGLDHILKDKDVIEFQTT